MVLSVIRDSITIFKETLNLEGHQNRITDSRMTAILLKKVNFPTGQSGEASRLRVCYQQGLPRLVFPELYSRPVQFINCNVQGWFCVDAPPHTAWQEATKCKSHNLRQRR